MRDTEKLVGFYLKARDYIITEGYEKDITYVESLEYPPSKRSFFVEYLWVVCNSGMALKAAESIFANVLEGTNPDGLKVNLNAIGHPKKREGVQEVWSNLDKCYNRLLEAEDKLAYLKSLPHIGDTTKYHLARNCGLLQYAKPDRHLLRLAKDYGYTDDDKGVQAMCSDISDVTKEPVGVVDVVLWRYCILTTKKDDKKGKPDKNGSHQPSIMEAL